MNDKDLFSLWCIENDFDKELCDHDKQLIKNTLSYTLFEASNAVKELNNELIKAYKKTLIQKLVKNILRKWRQNDI